MKEETEVKQKTEEEVDNSIGFFKKIYYSIAKVSKYDEMVKEGLWSATKYFLLVVSILAIIMSIAESYIKMNDVNSSLEDLKGSLPELTVKDNQLILAEEQATIFDQEDFIEKYGCAVVINPYLEQDEAVSEYYMLANENHVCYVFLKEKFVQISSDYAEYLENKDNSEEKTEENTTNSIGEAKIPGINTFLYKDITSYINNSSNEYTKDDIVNELKQKAPSGSYIVAYFITYEFILIIMYALFILMVSLSGMITIKILKMQVSFKNLINNTIYASTLSLILYVLYTLISYFANFVIPGYSIISLIIIYIYLFIILKKKREAK